ncbi:MAG: hypothetical protein JW737_07420 [Acidobacteria bacterium]|nr:hypothetical protein [Acidobacteriota bacterium]
MFSLRNYNSVNLFFLFIFLIIPIVSFSANNGPIIQNLNIPSSVPCNTEFSISFTVKAQNGIKAVSVEFEGKKKILNGNSLTKYTFKMKMSASSIGKQEIKIRAIDNKNRKSQLIRKTTNVTGTIAKPGMFTVSTSTPKKIFEGKKQVDSSKLGVKTIDPEELVKIDLKIYGIPMIVGEKTQAMVVLDRVAPSDGYEIKVDIKTIEGNEAGGFVQRHYDLFIRQGNVSATFEMKSSKEYPEGVDIIASLGENRTKKSIKVLWPAEVKDITFGGSDSDVYTFKGDTNNIFGVVLDKPALRGGTEVRLSADGPAAGEIYLVPDKITIPEGETSGKFSLQIKWQAEEYLKVTAKGFSKSSSITVNIASKAKVKSLSIVPFHLHRGESAIGTVKLEDIAFGKEATVNFLLSDYGAQFVSMPDSVIIPGGKDEASFDIKIGKDALNKSKFTVMAYVQVHEKISQQYIINPFRLIGFTISPDLMVGKESTLAMKIDGPAPEGGLSCSLKIKTPEPDSIWAYGILPHQLSFKFPQGSSTYDVSLKTEREYLDGVDFYVTCISDDIFFEKKGIKVISNISIESVLLDPPIVNRGRITLGTVTLNHPSLDSSPTPVKIELLSDWAAPYVELQEDTVIPIGQVEAGFSVKVKSDFPLNSDRFFIKLSLANGDSKSLAVEVR